MNTFNDLQFIRDWDANPQQVFLPLKKYGNGGGLPQCACLVLDHGPVLFHTNMFAFNENCVKERFESYEDIVAAGWVVD
jgi:hypothetical protein